MLIFSVQTGVSCIWVNDSQRFLLENFDAIHNTPSYLYHSALPFSPSSSWLRECYITELSQEFRVVKGLQAGWGTCSRTVVLNSSSWALSYWNNTVATGSEDRVIYILDATTGIQTAVLLGHTNIVRSLTFSPDGTSLVSGSDDSTVKLWDIQTGGVVKTFSGHTSWVLSVSISADNTIIASGSKDNTMRLWNTQTGTCYKIIEQEDKVDCVCFSPKNPLTLISTSALNVQQWDINGHKVGLIYEGHQAAFSPDGTQLMSCTGGDVIIKNTISGVVMANFYAGYSSSNVCCFSPDGRLVAIATNHNVSVWDITDSHPHLIETLIGHTASVTSITFSSPSTLISTSLDESVKFWWIDSLLADSVMTDSKSMPLILAPTSSVSLKATSNPIIPNDLPDGVIETWGILSDLYNGYLQVPAEDSHQSNIQSMGDKLIFVWYTVGEINIWDTEEGELLWTIDVPGGSVVDLRVSGDGSKIFCLYEKSIQAWDIWTKEAMGEVEFQNQGTEILTIDSSAVWVSNGWRPQGLDFGIPGLSPVQLPEDLPDWLYLNDTTAWETITSRVWDVDTEKIVFQLPERFGKVVHVQWGGQYLVASFRSKEVLILDFNCMSLSSRGP